MLTYRSPETAKLDVIRIYITGEYLNLEMRLQEE